MPITNYQNDLMIKLNKDFIRGIFIKLSIKFGSSTKASLFLKIPRPTFYAYKNRYVSSIPKKLLFKILNLKIISQKDVQKNKISEYNRNEYNQDILNEGRSFRNSQLKKWKSEIPKINKILTDNYLDFEKWFLSYQKLINFGARKFNYVKQKKEYIEVSYITHSNKNKKEFILKFPRKMRVDKEFLYLFGLWVGDKAGGKRFGVMNTNKEVISFTKSYLKRLYQKSEIVLYIAKDQENPKYIKYDKIVIINNKQNGYAFSIHAVNGILTSFFDYLQSNLSEILYNCRDFSIFFAGLFDAEGNIFLEESCFRWSCKDEKLIKIFQKHLTRLNLFDRFDGVNLITYNKRGFEDKILPYLKHSKKINNSNLVIYAKGKLEKRFLDIINTIKKKEGITNKELAKVLNKKKIYAQVRFLEKIGYVYSKNYPKQIYINKTK